MRTVEFIYDNDCPNVKEARSNLVRAFVEAKLTPNWTEWDRNAPESPEYAKRYGSPSILINGHDIGNEDPTDGNNCRIYVTKSGNSGVPPVHLIAAALSGKPNRRNSSWKTAFAAVPGIGIVLLPKLTCAACWPAYAAILSSMGFGFFNYSEYLFPISVAALLITLFALGFRAKRRRGYGPLYLGLFASVLALTGKFYMESNPVFYFSVAILILASVWNSWPKKNEAQACAACEA